MEVKIAIAQCNPTVGDTDGNVRILEKTLDACAGESPDLAVFSELFLTGYPPRDLLERGWFLKRANRSLERVFEISERYPQTGILLGAPIATDADWGKGLYNAALLIENGRLLFSQAKSLLPTYDVFDEGRYFDPARTIDVAPFKDEVLGISICEDAWNDPDLWPRRFYPIDPQSILAEKGATLLINISASPFHLGKETVRTRIFRNHARKHRIPFLCVNQVGGNDELVFDGRSVCVDGAGTPIAGLPAFEEAVRTIDLARPPAPLPAYRPQDEIESLHRALVLGLRDYVKKCGFASVVLGLSGGIDSAVVCCLAAEALGAEHVVGVAMPGPYSSAGSLRDARALAHNLGIEFAEIPITPIYHAYKDALADHLTSKEGISVTLENVQARIRGNVLMALSNEYGHLVLSTGNKSETAMGYCTLYGDMSGGLAVISDVSKTLIYRLARHINRSAVLIPEETMTKPPSAELRPDQKDLDSLPPYDVLDPILHRYVDENDSVEEIVGLGFDPEIVKRIARAVDRNEYKRRQAAPGLRVTPKAFGSGRRMPIAAKLCG